MMQVQHVLCASVLTLVAARCCQAIKVARPCRVRVAATEQAAAVNAPAGAAFSRRLAMGAAILAPALVRVLPTQAAAGGPCELHALPSGLEWCDLQEGDGPVPLKGALYK
jgi:hypothetical protein